MIGFTATWALVGLAAAAIPLLLHLFARREPPTVVFPATRYLAETARARHRRLTLQHWLLLLVRSLLIAALAFAAAGPTIPTASVATHLPTALVLILDNSLSSAATVNGTPVLDRLRRAAHAVLGAARAEDALWLITADGIPRRGGVAELAALLDRVVSDPRRLDLGEAITLARETMSGQPLPSTAVVLSDLQATAFAEGGSARDTAASRTTMVVIRPQEDPVFNLGVARLDVGRQPWGPEGGRVTLVIAGDERRSAAVAVRFGERPPRQQLARGGATISIPSGTVASGWWAVRADLEPDELRLDDARVSAVRIAPPARATWRSEERFLGVAGEVLVQNGRLVRGSDLTIGSLGPGPSIVQPPADPAVIGALNRALAARGVGWRYGDPVPGATITDSGSVLGTHRVARRYALIPLSGSGASSPEVLITAGGSPWLVRSGEVLLLGSRLEPDWTELPLAAPFVPFVDLLANRAVRGELALLETAPGDPVTLPSAVTAVARDGGVRAAQGGELFRWAELGIHYLLAGRDTVGTVAVNPDPRESDLTRIDDGALRRLLPGVRLVRPEQAGAAAFAAGGRADLRGPVLVIAALLALADAGLAGWRATSRRAPSAERRATSA
ncbi:MAG: BatA domain-containing protein [Gemmatimonadales bacterium]